MLEENIWQILHGCSPYSQLCCSFHRCMFLTHVAPFKKEIIRFSYEIRFTAKKHCYMSLLLVLCISYIQVFMTDRSYDTRQSPLCAEESVAVEASLCIQTAVQHIHTYNVGVHGVGVLPHGSLDHRLPGVTAQKPGQNHNRWQQQSQKLFSSIKTFQYVLFRHKN